MRSVVNVAVILALAFAVGHVPKANAASMPNLTWGTEELLKHLDPILTRGQKIAFNNQAWDTANEAINIHAKQAGLKIKNNTPIPNATMQCVTFLIGEGMARTFQLNAATIAILEFNRKRWCDPGNNGNDPTKGVAIMALSINAVNSGGGMVNRGIVSPDRQWGPKEWVVVSAGVAILAKITASVEAFAPTAAGLTPASALPFFNPELFPNPRRKIQPGETF